MPLEFSPQIQLEMMETNFANSDLQKQNQFFKTDK